MTQGHVTFGELLKHQIDNEQTHLEYLSINFGSNSREYLAALKKLENKQKYMQNIKGHQAPNEAARG